jgi:lysophospholipase L1-like esterase
VAQELQTYLIDLNQLSEDYFNKVGPVEGARLTWSATDRTHFNLAGAEAIAGIVIKALPAVLSAQVTKSSQ